MSFICIDGSCVRARIFERGVGETLSSGTGASGAAVAAFLGGAPSPVTVKLDGGELTVEITAELDMTLIGVASRVYAGELDAAFVDALRG
jgi:diaminopimelate epimerase